MVELSEKISSPLDYLKIFFRRKWLLIIPTFLGVVLGICAGILLPKKYLSSTIILVEEGKTDNPLFSNLAVSTTVQQRLDTIRESMLGWNSLVKLVKRLNLDKEVQNEHEFEQLILGIRRSILIKLRGSNILELSYIADTPEETQAVVKNVTDIFIERNVEIQNTETTDAIKFIQEQLRVYRGKIKSAEIAQIQEQLNTLLIDSTENHPHVKQLREQVAAKKAELEKENLEYSEDIMLDAQTTNPIIDEIKRALDNIEQTKTTLTTTPTDANKDVYKVMLIDKLDNVMARDVRVNENIYNMLLQRLETAKITQRLQSSKEGTKYTILDPPRLPLQPFQPNKPLVAMMGLFLGGILGAAMVVLMEFLDKSFLDVEDAKNYLGMPLLGAISKISTMETVREEKERQRWILGTTLAIGVIAIFITAAFSMIIH